MPLNELFTYKVLKPEAGIIRALIDIDTKHRLYNGHFPGKPVTPGVVLIEIIRIILSDSVKKDLMLAEAKDIKFIAPVVPPDTHNLDLEINYNDATEGITANCILSGNNQVYTKMRAVFSEIK